MMMPTTALKELYHLRRYIQHLILESEYEYDDDDFDNPLNEDNWLFQNKGKFMKYVIYNRKAWTHKHLDRSTITPITKANPNHRLHTDEEESDTPTGSSEGSIYGTPTASSEGPIPI